MFDSPMPATSSDSTSNPLIPFLKAPLSTAVDETDAFAHTVYPSVAIDGQIRRRKEMEIYPPSRFVLNMTLMVGSVEIWLTRRDDNHTAKTTN